jgi:phage terminase small subunit
MQGVKLNKFEKKGDPRDYADAKKLYDLTFKQWRFCMAYIGEAECVAYKAAAMTYGKADGIDTEGGSMTYLVAKSVGLQNMKKPNIQACIQDLLGVAVMQPNEVMHRLSKMASANIAELLDVDPLTGTAKLNLEKAMSRGAMYLVKKLNFDSFGNLKSVEIHDSFAALGKIGQHYKLFDRNREAQIDPKDLARELLDDLRARHEEIPDAMLIAKVLDRFSGSGVTESDLVDNESQMTN